VIESSYPEVFKLKMRGRILRSGVYWQGALKENGVKQVGRRTRLMLIDRSLHYL